MRDSMVSQKGMRTERISLLRVPAIRGMMAVAWAMAWAMVADVKTAKNVTKARQTLTALRGQSQDVQHSSAERETCCSS
jgi:hypothetical protein